MKQAAGAGERKRVWVAAGVVLFAALDIALVGAAYVHGHPEVQGTTGPITTYSSPMTPGSSPSTPRSPHTTPQSKPSASDSQSQ
jgi:hypothetical protein